MKLSQQLRNLRASKRVHEIRAQSPRTDPRIAHEAKDAADREAKQIKGIERRIDDNRNLAARITALGEEIEADSPQRSTACRKMKEAAMWLREEIE